MPLGTRILQVAITLPNSNATVKLDQSINIKVRISKNALAMQPHAEVTLTNLTQSLRQQLLSQFTAWNLRQVQTGKQPSSNYCDITITAGNANTAKTQNGSSSSGTTVVFTGQIAKVDPAGAPPNQAVTITCYARQTDKLQFKSGFAPTNTTFGAYVAWAAEQMGVARYVCDTSFNDTPISNPFASSFTLESLLIDLQTVYRPAVTAFIDNDTLIVMDSSKAVSDRGTVNVDQFIGTPMWTEWGVTFTVLFNPNIILACAVILSSVTNPSLNNSAYVVTSLEYDLTSRDGPFYVKVDAALPA